LLTAVLAHRAAAAVGVRTCWPWETAVTVLRCRLLGGAKRFGANGGGEGRGHTVAAARLQLVLLATLLPEKVDVHYQRRPRNSRETAVFKINKMHSSNFIIRML